MTTYARINAAGDFERLVELTVEQYAALQVNGKAQWLRAWVVDQQPTPTATQVVERGPVVVSATEARQTWSLRDKLASELESESIIAERNSSIDGMLTDITAQRAVTRTTWDAYTAVQLRAEQWRDRQVLLRFANLLARRMKLEVL